MRAFSSRAHLSPTSSAGESTRQIRERWATNRSRRTPNIASFSLLIVDYVTRISLFVAYSIRENLRDRDCRTSKLMIGEYKSIERSNTARASAPWRAGDTNQKPTLGPMPERLLTLRSRPKDRVARFQPRLCNQRLLQTFLRLGPDSQAVSRYKETASVLITKLPLIRQLRERKI